MEKYDANQSHEFDPLFQKAADTEGVSMSLLRKLSWNESRFKADAKSPTGPLGPMQFTTATAKAMGLVVDPAAGIDERTDPAKSIAAGAKLLGSLVRKYNGDELKAALAYNQGEGSGGRVSLDAYDQGDFSKVAPEGLGYMRNLLDVAKSPNSGKLEAFGGISPKADGVSLESVTQGLEAAPTMKVGENLPVSGNMNVKGQEVPEPEVPFGKSYWEAHGETLDDVAERSTFFGMGAATHAEVANSTLGVAFRAGRVDNGYDVFKDTFTPTKWNSHTWTPEELERIRTEVKNPDYINVVTGGDAETLDDLIKLANENYENDAKAAGAGLGAKLSAGVIGAAVDPLSYVPLAGASFKGAKVIKKALVVGAQTAGINVASEGIRTSVAGGEAHFAEAAAGGLLFGAGMSAIADGLMRKAGRELDNPFIGPSVRVEARETARNAGSEDLSRLPANSERLTGEHEGVPFEELTGGDVRLADGSVLGANNPINPKLQRDFAEVDPERAAWGVQFGGLSEVGLRIHRSEDARVRTIGTDLVRSPTGFESGSNGKFGATASDIHERLRSADNRTYNSLFDAVKTAMKDPEFSTGAQTMSKAAQRELIYKRATLAIERPELADSLTKSEKAVMKIMKDHFDGKREMMERPIMFGNPNAVSIFPNSRHIGTYVPNVYSKEAKQLYAEKLGGADNLQEAIKQSWLTSYHSRPEVKQRVDDALMEQLEAAQPKTKVSSSGKVKEAQAQMKLDDAATRLGDKVGELGDVLKNAEKRVVDRETKLKNSQARIKAHEDALEALKDQLAAKPGNKTLTRRISEREARIETQRYHERQNTERLTHMQGEVDKVRERIKEAKAKHDEAVKAARAGKDAQDLKAAAEVDAAVKPEVTMEMVEKYAHDKAYGISHSGQFHGSTLVDDNINFGEGLVGLENNQFLEARNLFDSDMSITLPDGSPFSVNDLREFDMRRIIPAYDRRVNGDISIMGGTGKTTGELKQDIMALKQDADSRKDGKLGAEVDALGEVAKILTGRGRRAPDGNMATLLRGMNDLSFFAKNAYMGVQNVTEIAGLMAQGNVRTLIHGIPHLQDLALRRKVVNAKELKELHATLFGKEVDDVLRPNREDLIQRLREFTNAGDKTTAAVGTFKYATQELAAHSPWTKLLNGTTNYLIDAGRQGVLADVMQATLSGKNSKFAKENLLKSASLTKEQWEGVKGLIREHAVRQDDGKFSIKDKKAFANDPRSMNLWRLADKVADEVMMRPHKVSLQDSKQYGALAKTFLQFKMFTIKSMNSKFMRSLYEGKKNNRAIDMALTWMISGGLAASYYVAQAHVKAVALPKEQQQGYLDKALNPSMIGYATLSRSSHFGAPLGLANLVMAPLGYDQAKMVRSSVLPQGDMKYTKEKAINGFAQTSSPVQNFTSGVLQQVPAFGWGANAFAAGYNAKGLIDSNSTYHDRDYMTGLMNTMRELVPNDPLSQQIILHIANEGGIHLDGK